MSESDSTATPRGSAAADDRAALETEIGADLRALTAVSEQLGHAFARSENLRPNDFRALLHVATAEFAGRPLTPGQLGKLMGMSSPAVTYLVERLSESGYLRRADDPTDRRRVILHHDDSGRAAAENFFLPLGQRTRAAMAEFSDADLHATHRVLTAVIHALRAHFDAVTDPATR
ncbi:MarR family transcriptional regulator [Nocardia otitidiscaviarum]|uniref:MarR family winged helix-turn-helix transcriptional regulator n=1 Tax=Nocardia otitidiscaviarum TaxID=1823 RepID=UPI001893AECD|nr:MarR family transcriptional regulator [Nocardia otitidiscaviarum]MBF6239432.1 MarR family transcriptional regulator [Nocardia otitidiscaviarum]